MKKIELLEKIEPLFFDKTYKEVSLQEIADLFEIKKSSLYYYFKSKDDLFLNLIDYSFDNYINFLKDIVDKDTEIFIESYIFYPNDSKNFFSVINQNGYCNNDALKWYISKKQKEIFDFLFNSFSKKHWFKEEKVFLFISLLEDIWRKKCIFWECPIDIKKVITQINLLFFK